MGKNNKKKNGNDVNFDLEKLRLEYSLFEDENGPVTLGGARVLLESYVDYMDDYIKLGRKETIRNNVIHCFGEIENDFLSLFYYAPDDLRYLDEDLGLVLDEVALSSMFRNFFVTMRDSLSVDNFEEMSKLAKFVKSKYLENYAHLESVRDVIVNRELGMVSYPMGEENRMAVQDFFREQYALIITKKVEKIKKI